MASKTHLRRVRAAKRALAATMRAEGLDPNKPADHLEHIQRLHNRIKYLGMQIAQDRDNAKG